MKCEIKHRFSGSVLFSTEVDNFKLAVEAAIKSSANLRSADLSYANLRSADLRSADLRSANLSYADLSYADLRSADLSYANLRSADLRSADLRYANLSYADLSYADLRSADLRSADLRSADLRYADLRSADLRYAIGINKYLSTPIQILRDQVGKIRAYKLVTVNGDSPIHDKKINYEIGKSYSVNDADTNEREQCAAGISLATLDWCLKEWNEGHRILVAEFEAADIAAIPISSDGKFRVHRCTIVGEKSLDELDWPPKKKE